MSPYTIAGMVAGVGLFFGSIIASTFEAVWVIYHPNSC